MKFKSAFNNNTKLTFLGILILLTFPLFFIVRSNDFATTILFLIINIAVLLLIVWIVLRTDYTILNEELKCQSGPFKKTIPILEITSIEHHKGILVPTLCKLSLSHEGFVINYNSFDSVYISPANQQQFLIELTSINPNIQIT